MLQLNIKLTFFLLIVATSRLSIITGTQNEINLDRLSFYSGDPRFILSTDFYNKRDCILDLFKWDLVGDYVCSLKNEKKKRLCTKIFPAVLNEIFKKLKKNDKESVDNQYQNLQIQNDVSSCMNNELIVRNDDIHQEMIPCVTTFEIWGEEKSFLFYISRTYESRMPMFLNKRRSVYVYQKYAEAHGLMDKTRKEADRKLPKEKYFEATKDQILESLKQTDEVELIGMSNDFNFNF